MSGIHLDFIRFDVWDAAKEIVKTLQTVVVGTVLQRVPFLASHSTETLDSGII